MSEVQKPHYRLQAVCDGTVKTIIEQTGGDYLIRELRDAVQAAQDWQAICGKPVRLYAFGSNGRAASLVVDPDRQALGQANRLSGDLIASTGIFR